MVVLDPITLDQLRMLAAVVDSGSFSAAARKLGRVQSAVSTAMANLESQLGVVVWDRTHRVATLTREGEAVLGMARRVLGEVDALRRLAAGMVRGVEASVALCVDAIFPTAALIEMARGFAREFPAVDLRVDVQTLSAVATRVVDGSATLGVATPLATAPSLERRALAPIRMVPVVAARHPLAKLRGPIARDVFEQYVQIVLAERATSGVPDQAVLSTRTWRVDDLHTKHAMLRAGLGWGNLPEHLVRRDLERKRLIELRPAEWARDEHLLRLAVIYRRAATLGPAHRWIVDQLVELCAKQARGT